MNVLFVASWYPSKLHETNGNFVEQHARAVIAAGAQVRVVHFVYSNRFLFPQIKSEMRNDISVYHVFFPRFVEKMNSLKARWFRKLTTLLDKEGFNPQIIHGHVVFPAGELAVHLSKHYQVPLVYTEHWSGYKPMNAHLYTDKVQQLTKYVLDQTDLILPVSHELGENMRAKGFQGRYEVVNNAVDTSVFYFKHRPKNEVFEFLHISNFHPEAKNVIGLIRGFLGASILNARLTIAGDGDLEPILKFIKSQNADASRIRIMGKMSYQEVAALMQYSDCFVLFSNYENSPCVISESHCCGLPVLATRVGGIPEMIDLTNGVLIEPGDETQLQMAMREMMARATSFRKRDFSHVAQDRYGLEPIGARFLRCYHQVLEK